MRKVLVILGPTATGKTDLALLLARKFNGELISCDSRQVYTGLDIGTGKMPSKFQISNFKFQIEKANGYWKINGIKIWMYDVVSPKIQYNVADYVKDASRVIGEIRKKRKLPIIVGGSGLYLKALLYGLSNLAIPVDKNLRKKLQKFSKEDLQERLKKLSPERWHSLNASDRENPRRLIRTIELILNQKLKIKNKNDKSKFKIEDLNILKIGLTAKKEALYKRTDMWVVDRLRQGMINEAENLLKDGLSFDRMRQLGFIYKVFADHLIGNISDKDILTKTFQNEMHAYVRRQLTWFKKEKDVFWFDIADKHFPKKLANIVSRWYDQPHVTKNRHLT